MPAEVLQVQDLGTYWLVQARCGDHTVRARLATEAAVPQVGDTVWLRIVGPHTCFYADNDELIGVAA
jgi:glycerol transport system ATP-binding protein